MSKDLKAAKKDLSRQSVVLSKDRPTSDEREEKTWIESVTFFETWASKYHYSVQNQLFATILSMAEEAGVPSVAEKPRTYLVTKDIVQQVMTACGLDTQWDKQLTKADKAAVKARKLLAPESQHAPQTDASRAPKPEKSRNSGYSSTNYGISIKWLKPGTYDCNILYDWCAGMKVIPEDSCPNGLLVEVDIYDSGGTKVDTAYASLGSLRSGEQGLLVFGSYVSNAKTASLSSADCF